MLQLEQMMQIKILYAQGYSMRAIAKELQISRNTVKKYLNQNSNQPPHYKTRPSRQVLKLEPFQDYIIQRIKAAFPDKIPATVLYRELLAKNYQGRISLLRAFVRQQRPKIETTPIRFETAYGQQMQVDWAIFRRGKNRLSALIATLGTSRLSYVEFFDNEQIETLLNGLANAFDYFGGVTQEILFDNMKTVVLNRSAYGAGLHRFNPKLWDFAKHYGFIPKLCQPYRPQTKGKVERFIGYLRQSFYIPLKATLAAANMLVDVDTANREVKHWLHEVANCRLHAGLQKKPIDIYAEEKAYLQPLTTHHTCVKPAPTLLVLASKIQLSALEKIIEPKQHELAIYQQLLPSTFEGNHNEYTT